MEDTQKSSWEVEVKFEVNRYTVVTLVELE